MPVHIWLSKGRRKTTCRPRPCPPLLSPVGSYCCVLCLFMRDTSGCWNLVFEGNFCLGLAFFHCFWGLFGTCPAQIDVLVEIDRLEAWDTSKHTETSNNQKKNTREKGMRFFFLRNQGRDQDSFLHSPSGFYLIGESTSRQKNTSFFWPQTFWTLSLHLPYPPGTQRVSLSRHHFCFLVFLHHPFRHPQLDLTLGTR